MTTDINDIQLDPTNIEFNNATDFVLHTDTIVYLTGKAGTGKTTFLKHIQQITNKNTVILAPTGVAAINAGGVTIHSFFKIPLSPFTPHDPRLQRFENENKESIYTTFKYNKSELDIIKNLDLLIIDEVSMVRVDIVDVIDNILRVYRGNNKPFGGVQVLLIGDTFQLPPIVKGEDWDILAQFYKTPFFFSAKVLENKPPIYIELKKIYRQTEQDFIDLLNRVRVSQITPKDVATLNSRCDSSISNDENDYIILATHNAIVKETNDSKLAQLDSEPFTYNAEITGEFPENSHPTDSNLELKVGAQVMFVRNDKQTPRRYYNGKIGKVKELHEDGIIVAFSNEQEVAVELNKWDNVKYQYNKDTRRIEEEVIGTFEQFPLKLAWAISVHKSQGLTFEKVIADLERAFAPGQVYVALSRCTSFNGLILKTPIGIQAIKTDARVMEFAQNETPNTLIVNELASGKADYYYKKSREELKNGEIVSAFKWFKKAFKYRNDLETDTFERFIAVYGSKMISLKKQNSPTFEQITQLTEELEDKQVEINNLIEVIIQKHSCEDENEALKNEIESLNDKQKELEASLLEQKTIANQFGKGLIKSEEKILSLTSDKARLRESLSFEEKRSKQLEADVAKAWRLIDSHKKTTEQQKAEIERLKSRKWHHLLFGKH